MGNECYQQYDLSLFPNWQLRLDLDAIHIAARQQRLIAALALYGPSLRSYLAGVLWPEVPEAKALESLRVTIHLINRQAPNLLCRDGAMISLSKETAVDLYRVRALLQEANHGKSSAAEQLLKDRRHLQLLNGWYEDWVLFEQGRLRHELLRVFVTTAQESLDDKHYGCATEAARAALDIEPLYEGAVRFLIIAEVKQGNSVPALLAAERFREQLKADMGITPSASFERLVENVLVAHCRREYQDSLADLRVEPILYNL